MALHFIDWLIVVVPLILVFYIGFKAQMYIKGVSDFLTAGRVAGRYVIAVSSGTAALGLITVVAFCEMHYSSGWAFYFWGQLGAIVGMLIVLTGFVAYRYREARVMTMAQLFEIRYSKSFRIFAGILAFISGLINYALFPAVGGRFLIYYCDFPDYVNIFSLQVNTFGLVMATFLILALAIVMCGGQLSTMVTDCVQGIFGNFIYLFLICLVLYFFSFDQMGEVLTNRPVGESFINPFNTQKLSEFNVLFILLGIIGGIYNHMSWQGAQGYFGAGENPHEQKMGGVLGQWRAFSATIVLILLALAAYTLMHHPDFSETARVVETTLNRIDFGEGKEAVTNTIRMQMRVPVALRLIFPVGFAGLFCAMMIFLLISTDTTYLHSWGSILVQDVILPFRKKAFTPKQQLLLLRLAILFVAIFAWVFSFLFSQVSFIIMFFALTGAIYMGASGSVILGGLYWKRGTAAGAWGAMIAGSSFAIVSFFLQNNWYGSIYPFLNQHFPKTLKSVGDFLLSVSDKIGIVHWEMTPERFPISGAELNAATMFIAIFMYISLSLLTCRKPFNMDKMLHRGKYNLEHQTVDKEAAESQDKGKFKLNWRGILGIDEEYTRGDKILAWSVFLWTVYNFLVFAFQALWNVLAFRGIFGLTPWSEEVWFAWWKYYTIPQTLFVALVTTIWFTIGGVRDLNRLFTKLKALNRDDSDDGRVTTSVDDFAEDDDENSKK